MNLGSKDNLPSWLCTLRRAAQLTQRQLAIAADVDPSFICLIERGERDLGAVGHTTVVKIAAALHVTPAELFPAAVGATRTA